VKPSISDQVKPGPRRQKPLQTRQRSGYQNGVFGPEPLVETYARIEQMNTQIRLLARQAFGFHSPRPLIALAMLKLAELCPPLPR
jgi:hypothetical protein